MTEEIASPAISNSCGHFRPDSDDAAAMLDIYVDADACPVKDEVLRVCGRHGLDVYMVSNEGLRPSTDPRVHSIIVGNELDAANDWIANAIGAGDIAVTADIPLAARCIEKGARVIAPTGKPFTADSIGMAVAMRDLMAQLRDAGEITGGPAGFSRRDRSRFLQALEGEIQAIRRNR